MSRRLPPDRDLRRRRCTRKPRLKIVVISEGQTECRYIRDFANDHQNEMIELELIPRAGVPLTVVRKAVEKRKELMREARRSKDSFDFHFEVWGIMDVDEHPNLAQALDIARRHLVEVGLSNPCFEL